MEELFNLVDELNNAAERRFTIKKLFWKVRLLSFDVELYSIFNTC